MIVVILLLGVATAIYVHMKWCFSYWSRRNVPTPEPSFLVGNIGSTLIFRKHMGNMIEDWYKKFNDLPYFGYYKLMKPAIVVRDPELVKNVMVKDFASFHDNEHQISKKIDPLFAQNPFFLDGDEWQTERKNVTMTITPAKLKALYPTMLGTCDKLVNYLKAVSPTDDIEAGDLSIFYSLENVLKCAFSIDANCFDRTERSPFLNARNVLFNSTSLSSLMFISLPLFPKWLLELIRIPMMSKDSEQFFRKLVADNKRSRADIDQPMNDIFEQMLKVWKSNDEDETLLTARATTIYFEGSETSGISLSFAMYALAQNPVVQDQIYAEIRDTLEEHNGELSFETFNDIKCLDNVLSEALRIYSPALYMAKHCTNSYTLPSIGNNPPVTIPPGTAVLVPVQALHSDSEHFPDADKFIPERFDDPDVRNSPVYLPFGSGPRNCVGMRFASLQVRLALMHIVKNYRIKVSPNHKPIVMNPISFMLSPMDGLMLNFERRTDA